MTNKVDLHSKEVESQCTHRKPQDSVADLGGEGGGGGGGGGGQMHSFGG